MYGEAKITSAHRARTALVYIRQSTLVQVRDNIESTARQYDLARRAVELGWAPSDVVVVDADLGTSGGFGAARSGFRELVSRVCLGGVGAVLGLEVSRLARSSAEFARLLELARLTDTLVIDGDGVYDLADVNDRLLLGLKGTLSEAELHLIAGRLHGAKLAAAGRGELRLPLPIGYVYDADQQIVQDPDEQVRAAVSDVFAAFAQTGSAYGVVQQFGGRAFPTRKYGGVFAGQLRMRPLTYARVLQILTNPTYAGAYSYGRRRVVRRVEADGTVRLGSRTAARAEWLVLIPDHHEGYISWQQFLDNEARRTANHTRAGARPVREGPPLCQGIMHCGACGGRMGTRYRFDRCCFYSCFARLDQAQQPGCRGISTRTVDAAVEQRFLQVVTSEQISLALQAAEEVVERHSRSHRAAELAVMRARYEAERAERAFGQVEPENRLVARTLEDRWEAKLRALAEAELALATARAARAPLPERDRLLALAADLPRLWHAPATTARDRKRLLRALLADVTLLPGADAEHAVIGLRWHSGASEQLTIRRYGPGRTSPEALDLLRERAATTSDADLADQLNAAGLKTGRGHAWDAAAVHRARNSHAIPGRWSSGACAGELTIRQLCERLGVTSSAVADWIKAGKLAAHRTDVGRWHIPFDKGVEAHCRDMIATSAHLGRKHRTPEPICEGEITVAELAAKLGITATAVLRWIREGKIAAHRTRVTRHWHIRWDDSVEAHCRDMIATSVRLGARKYGGAVACEGELTIRQLQDKLGIGRGTVLRWITTGEITAHQTTQGYWHIPFDAATEAHCRELVDTSPRLGKRPPTQQTDEGGAV
ncbi:helix-turn-helix domain-containing protein [Nonomuraea rubra]